MNKKKLIIAILVTMMILVGCGNNQEDNQSSIPAREVENCDMMITIIEQGETTDIYGKYTGPVVAGKPHGEGTFLAENDNIVYEYNGYFMEGRYNGYGTSTVTIDGVTTEMAGTYTNGEFTPTPGESFDYVGQFEVFGYFAISEEIIEYIDANTNLFPITNKDTVKSIALEDFSYKQFVKTRKQDQIGLVKQSLYVAQIFEDDFLDGKLTSILGVDDDDNYYVVYYLDSVDVYDGDRIVTYAVPCTTSSFSNIGGGTTNVVVMAACYIE